MEMSEQRMLMVASQFDALCDEMEKLEFHATSPQVVNAAFACEVYLKTLCFYFQNTKQNGHNLHKLLKMQNIEIQDEIFQEYKIMHSARPVLVEFIGVMNKEKFESDIKEVSNAFVDWRYSYESPRLAVRLGILNFFRLSLRIVARRHIKFH